MLCGSNFRRKSLWEQISMTVTFRMIAVGATIGLGWMISFASLPAQAQAVQLVVGNSPSEDVIALSADGLDLALSSLPELVEDILERSGVPGAAVAVVHGGETVFSQGFGVRELGKPQPVTADTVFQIASLSKPLSGTVGAIEVSSGRVGWDDKATDYLPSLRLADDYVTSHATIGDFFAHRSGLPMAAGDDLEDIGYSRDEIISRLRFLSLDAFRTSYHYANFGITIGAEAIAAAAGQDWETLADEVLFEPLGMTSSSFRYSDYLARENRATLHAYVEGRFQPLYQRDADAQAPAGGASSSANDLAEWLQLLLANGQYGGVEIFTQASFLPAVSPQAFSAQPHLITARPSFYGYGFNVGTEANGRTSFSHSGAFVLGAGTNMRFIPSANIGIVVLTNGAPVGAAEAISTQFLELVQYGEVTRDWFGGYNSILANYLTPVGDLVGQTPPEDLDVGRTLSEYVGAYDNPYFGGAEIRQVESGLEFVFGPAEVTLAMTPWGSNRFAVAPQNENAPDGSISSLTFEEVQGEPASFVVEYLNGYRQGLWTRRP